MSDVVTIGDIVLSGVTSIDDSGAWNAPEKRTEQGFQYSTYVRQEPVEVSLEAWVPVDEYRSLQSLRESGEPFPASVGQISISRAKLESLNTKNEAKRDSHYQVSITIKQITEAEIETTEISIETESGAMGSSAADTEPSLGQPEDNDGGQVEDESGGIVDSLSGFRESLSGVL
ncbi:hypothetical protein BDK61_2666 [Haloarcula quadrata]|uniref:Dit-like phage tail protein N-terminal domain-containing protein n=1 Tax=Haloarcula quadrata TaxID=182779 RepID=A0A495R7N4_9EURY|nr:hypothetical protein [Haloarcula quadrata]RKS83323.1 hypothetical protein BDK61_2666 [Haloarcula quadrata]